VRRILFLIACIVSLLLMAATVLLCLRSYEFKSPAVDDMDGASMTAPDIAIQLPIPSDAAEYVVFVPGYVEHWDYAPWEKTWHKDSQVPAFVPILAFSILPFIALLRLSRSRQVKCAPLPNPGISN
jgi:hypothetical protein